MLQPGITYGANVTLTVFPVNVNFGIEIWLGDSVKVTTSDRVSFVSSGFGQTIPLTIRMPLISGMYRVHVDIYLGNTMVGRYEDTPVGVGVESSGGSFRITIDHTKIESSLTNRPIAIRLGTVSGITEADTREVLYALGESKYKFKITLSDGVTQCYTEIVKWDSANGEAVLYIKVPSISSVEDTVLYLFYDNLMPDNTSYIGVIGSNPAMDVWDNNYTAVYHLSEQGNGASGEFKDSTRNHNNGTGKGSGGAPTRVNGLGGFAQQFNGSNQLIAIPDSNGFSRKTTGYLTMSIWINPTTLDIGTGEYVHIWAKGNWGSVEWNSQFYGTRNSGGNYPGKLTHYAYNLGGGLGDGASLWSPGKAFMAGTWNLGTWVMIPSGMTSYLNAGPWEGWLGQYGAYDTQPIGWSYANNQQNGNSPVAIGAGSTDGSVSGFYKGNFAEIRFSNVARSTSWINVDYYDGIDLLVSLEKV